MVVTACGCPIRSSAAKVFVTRHKPVRSGRNCTVGVRDTYTFPDVTTLYIPPEPLWLMHTEVQVSLAKTMGFSPQAPSKQCGEIIHIFMTFLFRKMCSRLTRHASSSVRSGSGSYLAQTPLLQILTARVVTPQNIYVP